MRGKKYVKAKQYRFYLYKHIGNVIYDENILIKVPINKCEKKETKTRDLYV